MLNQTLDPTRVCYAADVDMPSEFSSGREVALFARPPIPGRCKTRLASTLGQDVAAELAKAFAEDTVTLVQKSGSIPRFHSSEPHPFFDQMSAAYQLPSPVLQCEGDLGAKMRGAFESGAFAILGTDVPSLPEATLAAVFAMRGEFELVLTPAADGGFVFISASRAASVCLTEPIRWSSRYTLADTLDAATRLSLTWALTTPHFDVDWESDLDLLRLQLRAEPNLAPRSAHVLL